MYVTFNFFLSLSPFVEDMGHGSCYVVEEQKWMFHHREKERESNGRGRGRGKTSHIQLLMVVVYLSKS